MKRVLVIGSGGAGKTTFARALAERTGIPLIHLDGLYWRAGWEPTPPDEWRSTVAALSKREAWIMDGNYGGTLDLRLETCDTVVFLDIPRLTCLWRVTKRNILHGGRTRSELPAGCPERLSWDFIEWIWTYPRRRRPGILKRLAALKNQKSVIILQSAAQMQEFLDSVSRTGRDAV